MKYYQKKLLSLLLLTVLTSTSIWLSNTNYIRSQIEVENEQIVNFQPHFDNLNVNGSIIIYDLDKDSFYQHNPQRNNTAFLPASTYKIPNSLIALETGVIKDDISILTWDGIERPSKDSPIENWNQDLNLRLAFPYSAVWFYQVLARKIGYQRMQNFIDRIEYGNQNIGEPENIDRFWLSGKLRITPQQQIDFLRRFYQNNLPFEQNNIDLVKDIMIVEKTPEYVLRAKTGWTTATTPGIGWYVGYLEQNDNVYFFATNLDIVTEKDLPARLEVTRLCLQNLGLL